MAVSSNNMFMLILTISALTICTCDGRSGYPLAAKESLLRFWRRVLPNVKLPPVLMEVASPLDATSLSVFAGFIADHTITDHIASFCTAADLPCNGDDKYLNGGAGTTALGSLYYSTSDEAEEEFNPQNATMMGMEEGTFFREELLVQGSNLLLPNLSDYKPGISFLPPSLAEKLPTFSSQSLAELMRMFRIPENSSLGVIMANTLQECELPPIEGEIKRCVTTVEGMAEFAVGILGAKMEVLTTWGTAGSGERVQVGKVNKKYRGKPVSCHPMRFPYLVYYCHSLPNLKVYEASLMQKKNEKINDGVAVCHMDTTIWNPKHLAFMLLGHKPGEIEICHWVYQNSLVWVPLP